MPYVTARPRPVALTALLPCLPFSFWLGGREPETQTWACQGGAAESESDAGCEEVEAQATHHIRVHKQRRLSGETSWSDGEKGKLCQLWPTRAAGFLQEGTTGEAAHVTTAKTKESSDAQPSTW